MRLDQLGYGFLRIEHHLAWTVRLTPSPDVQFTAARLSMALSEALVWAEANPRT